MTELKKDVDSKSGFETLNQQQTTENESGFEMSSQQENAHYKDVKLYEKGWNKIKSHFKGGEGESLHEGIDYLPLTVFIATCLGFFYGGKIGSRQAKEKYMAMNHNTKFSSSMQAQRGVRDAGLLGFIRQGSKWGWKMGLFAGIFSGSSVLLTSFRGKEDGLNYIAAGGITGGLYRIRMGVMPAVGGAVLGLWISFPLGVMVYGLEKLIVRKEGKEEKDKRKENILEAHQAREIQWKQRLDVTSTIVDEMEKDSHVRDLEEYYTPTSSTNNCTLTHDTK